MTTASWRRVALLVVVAASVSADFGLWPHCSPYSILEPGVLIYLANQRTDFQLFFRDCRRNLRSTAFLKDHLPIGIYVARNHFTSGDFTTYLRHCVETDDFPLNINEDLVQSLGMKFNIGAERFKSCPCLFPGMSRPSYLQALRHVNLTSNSLEEIDENIFSNFYNLEILDLSYNFINYIHEDAFKYLTKVGIIKLEDNQISSFSVNVFKSLGSLKELDLSNNVITYIAAGSFGSTLEKINLSGNKLTYLPTNFCSSLHSLIFFNFEFNPWQCACLGELLSELRRTDVNYSRRTFTGEIPVCAAIGSNCKRPTEYIVENHQQ